MRSEIRIRALLGAAAWNTQALAVNFTRWGFSHGVAGTLILATLFCFLKADKKHRTGHLFCAALLMGTAVTMTYWTLPGALVLLIALLWRHRWRGALASIGLAVPMALLVAVAVALWGSEIVRQDIRLMLRGPQMASAAGSTRTLGSAVNALAGGYANALFVDPHAIVGTIGLLCVPGVRNKILVAALVLSLAILPVLSAGDILHNFYYRAMTFCPLLFLGFGAGCGRLIRFLRESLRRLNVRLAAYGSVALACVPVGLLLWACGLRIRAIAEGITTPIDVFCVRNIPDSRAALEFLNRDNHPGRFIIASPMIAQGFDGRAVHTAQVARFLTEEDTTGKYIHDLSLKNARYFVVDQLLYAHTLHSSPASLELAWTIEKARWPLVWEKGEYRIYANPDTVSAAAPPKRVFHIGSRNFYIRLAGRRIKAKRYQDAIACLGRVRQIHPGDVEALNMLAVVNAKLSRYRQAVRWVDAALRISPDNTATRRNRDSILRAWRRGGKVRTR